jgi:mannosyltransferase OCH1-like enzyme
MSIPKILHQLWIGPKPAPSKHMETWKAKNTDFEYIYWNEEEIKNRNITFKCQSAIDGMEEINGKADIMRWEILYKYGGFFEDADSIAIEPISDELMSKTAFAGYENEIATPGLIATGTMGFTKRHRLCRDAIHWIRKNPTSFAKTGRKAWQNVGPLRFP